jgi:hypothetical protein
MSEAFAVRLLELESRRVESGTFELEPQHEQAARIVALMRSFVAGRPAEFRERLPFMKQGDWEADWKAAAGGVAFVSFHEAGEPVSLGVLLAGIDPAADMGMSSGFEQAVLSPMLGPLKPEEREQLFGGEGPRLIVLLLPGRPELNPAAQLLNAALAAVFFRALRTAEARGSGAQ